MVIDALNFSRRAAPACIQSLESTGFFYASRHGFGFVSLYLAWLLTAVAFVIKAFIPATDLRSTNKALYYKAELQRQRLNRNPFKAAIINHFSGSAVKEPNASQKLPSHNREVQEI
ncbi:MAG: hypothetical protein SGPRY_007343 [Prymnesium sp.]